MTGTKFNLVLLILFCNIIPAIAQKPPIEPTIFSDWKKWNSLAGYTISPNGKFATYTDRTGLHTVLTDGQPVFSLTFAVTPQFTNDSKLVLSSAGDLLFVCDLNTRKTDTIKGVSQLIVPSSGIGNYIAYKNEGKIILHSLKTGKKISYDAVDAQFNAQGDFLILNTNNKIIAVNTISLKQTVIETGQSIKKLIIDGGGTFIAYITGDAAGSNIGYANLKTGSSEILINGKNDLPEGLTVQTGFSDKFVFSQDAQSLYFSVNQVVTKTAKQENVLSDQVDIWNYKDFYPKTSAEVMEKYMSTRNQKAVVSIANRKISILENKDREVLSENRDKYVIVKNIVNDAILYYDKQHVVHYSLFEIATGKIKQFATNYGPFGRLSVNPFITPDNSFVIWYNQIEGHYYSYEISTEVVRNISKNVSEELYVKDNGKKYPLGATPGVAGWINDSRKLLVYGRKDVWILDPSAGSQPVNITNGYGKANNIVFRSIYSFSDGKGGLKKYRNGEELILWALDDRTKQNGFWKVQIGTQANPVKLTMDDALYHSNIVFGPPAPMKAKESNTYLVTRQKANESPNVYATKDFKVFTKLSNIHPEKQYNWMTAELISWTVNDTLQTQGILFKPDNFDPSKKYPVIFNYYELMTDELHKFIQPDQELFNIPWYVSNGYLVCLPDIHYTSGKPALSATAAVVSAAKYLSRYPWVNMQKLGLQGHSFGGYETNCIIANSDLFAAAQEGAGVANVSSSFGGVGFGKPPYEGGLNANLYEVGQGRMNTTPWEAPDLFVENSPIFRADKIKTPLLIMHNKGDGPVSFMQGMEMYNALSRLQKPVWLLQYDDSQHLLDSHETVQDFSLRQRQFFEHYLRDKPAPIWMVEGVKFLDKGLRSGLELDSLNRKP